MKGQKTLHIRISGRRDNQSLRPGLLDVDEWIKTLENARNLLVPDGKGRPSIRIEVEEGSVLFKVTTVAALVIQTQALLAEVNSTRDIGLLHKKQADALSFFQQVASKEHFTITFGEQVEQPVLSLEKGTELKLITEELWVDAELYVKGKITNIGGKTQPNIHVDTSDYGLSGLMVNASEEQLAKEEKNRLYKQQELRIRIKQNVQTGEYDPKSAVLIAFVDQNDTLESADDYLDRLIEEATPHWEAAGDLDKWLKEVRGYE